MQAITYSRRHVPALAAAGSVASLVVSNWLLAGPSMRRCRAVFTALESVSPHTQTVFVLFHGLWDAPGRFEWLPDYLAGHGQVVLVMSGGNDMATPAATVTYLTDHDLADRDIYIVGFSKGSLNAALTARLLLARGITPKGLVIKCGPGSPQQVRWPNRYLPALVRILPPGPITNFGWHLAWRRKAHRATAAGDMAAAAQARWCCQRHVGSVLTGARLLARGIGLVPGEFAPIPCRAVFEQTSDPLIAPSAQLWATAMGSLTTLVTVPTTRHGDFGGGRAYYQDGWQHLLAA